MFEILGGKMMRIHDSMEHNNYEADLYVSTLGNDHWSGKIPNGLTDGSDGPLKTLEEAKKRVRKLQKKI